MGLSNSPEAIETGLDLFGFGFVFVIVWRFVVWFQAIDGFGEFLEVIAHPTEPNCLFVAGIYKEEESGMIEDPSEL